MYSSSSSSRLTYFVDVKVAGSLSMAAMSAWRVIAQNPEFGAGSGFQNTGASRRRVSNWPQAWLLAKVSRLARSTSDRGTGVGGTSSPR